MFTRSSLTLAAVLVAGCASSPAPDAQAVLRQAEQTLGAVGVKTIQFSARGSGGTFGQAWQPTMAWPGLHYSAMTRRYNLDTGAFAEEFSRSRAEVNGGGALPLMGQGEQRATGYARDGFA